MLKYKKAIFIFVFFLTVPLISLQAYAGTSLVVKELLEYFSNKFSRELVEQGGKSGVEKLTREVIERYGDEIVPLLRKSGPRALKMIDAYGDDAVRMITKYGDDGLTVLRTTGREVVPLVKKYGDETMEVCIKHPELGKELATGFGSKGIQMAKKLTTPGVIKTVRMTSRIKDSGKAKEIIEIILKYGEKAVNHIDKHKMLYFVAAPTGYIITNAGIAFAEEPGKFLDAGAGGIRLLITGTGSADEIQSGSNNILVFLFVVTMCLSPIFWWIYLRHKRTLLNNKERVLWKKQ